MLDHILSILIFFPALAAMLGFVVHKDSMRSYGVAVATIEFALSLWLWFAFDSTVSGMQFMEQIALVPTFGINYIVGVDGISLFIVVLASFFTMIGIASLGETKDIKNLIITLLFLQMTMAGVFSALDAIVFYVFWELSLVPMLYIIGAWGGPLRIYASVKFFLYTFAGSLVMLVGMLFMAYFYFQATGEWSFAILDWYRLILPESFQLWLFAAFFMGFAIKVPMFPFHTWLPYAHGQAPTIGSVILAAILLKMGTYAFVRFSLPLFPVASVMPRYATIFGIMMMASVGLPLTINFVGEFLSLLGFYKQSHMLTLTAGVAIIVGAIYMLAAYKKMFFGTITNEANKKLKDLNKTEYLGLIPLTIVAIWLGVYPKPVLEPINNSVESVIQLMHDKAQSPEAKARIPDLSGKNEIIPMQEAH